MTEQEVRLKCLELAMEQARNEGMHGDRNKVAEIANVFYNLTQGTEIAQTADKPPKHGSAIGGRGRKPGADKSVFD